MIGAFEWRDGQLMSEVGGSERRIFIRLFRDVRDLIVQPLTRSNLPPGVDERPGESSRDLEILQALDFEPDLDWGSVPGRHDDAAAGHLTPVDAAENDALPAPISPPEHARGEDEQDIPPLDPPDDPALAHLLPPMSLNVEEAARIRAIIEPGLRAEKGGKLSDVLAELIHPSGPGHRVVAHDPTAWMQAMNDVRVVMATRIGLYEAEDPRAHIDHLYEDGHREEDKMLATLYDVLSWWQDSLLTALGRSPEAG